ncbi:hypothetical protein BDA96_10G343100 [Sorghum bicolor]|uniref:Secreted protein n=1 Tax=Sorghum bicolor TaxID=4558 RepID=A0A921Q6U8_SORBI|nr:hypothetical protein BDA96_10G343100 [Sorghum bicolor]
MRLFVLRFRFALRFLRRGLIDWIGLVVGGDCLGRADDGMCILLTKQKLLPPRRGAPCCSSSMTPMPASHPP